MFRSQALTIVALIPLTTLLAVAGGCMAGGPDEIGSDEERREVSAALDPGLISWPPPPPECHDEECSGITCPDGYSRVGADGVRGAYCIEQQQRSTETYLQAMTECFTTTTSTGDVPHLCTPEEWYIACTQGPDLGEDSIDDMTNDYEWVADSFTRTQSMVIGDGACEKTRAGAVNRAFAFRCCID